MTRRHMSESDQILRLEAFLPYRLSVLSNRISQSIAASYRKQFGLSVTEWRVMAVLAHTPNLSANQVVQRTAMDKVAVSRAVAGLQVRGLLSREVDENDLRRSILCLSGQGKEIYAQVMPLALAFEQRILGELPEAERELLFRLLDRLDELELLAEEAGENGEK